MLLLLVECIFTWSGEYCVYKKLCVLAAASDTKSLLWNPAMRAYVLKHAKSEQGPVSTHVGL